MDLMRLIRNFVVLLFKWIVRTKVHFKMQYNDLINIDENNNPRS